MQTVSGLPRGLALPRERPRGFTLWKREVRASAEWLPLISTALLLAVILGLLAFIVYMTFVPGLPTQGGFTLDHWARLVSSRLVTRVVPNTILVGLIACAVATLFSLPLAWFLNRTDLPFRNTFVTLVMVVTVMPGYAVAMGWIMLVDDQIGLFIGSVLGLGTVPVSVTNSLIGVGWVLGLVLAPAVYFMVAAPMRSIDPSLGEAASMSGAGPLTTLLRVDVPLMWPAVLGSLIYTFMSAVSIFEIPALLGAASDKIPVLASEMFYAVRPGGPQASTFAYGAAGVYGLVVAVPSLVAMFVYLRVLMQSDRFRVVTGKGYRRKLVELRGWTSLGFSFVVSYLLLVVVFPFATLAWASLLPVLEMPSASVLGKVSLTNYQGLFVSLGGAHVLTNTVLLVITVSVLVSFFSFMASWVVVRTSLPYRKVIDSLAMLPHAIPGLAFAFALAMLGIFAAARLPWLPLAGTVGIITVAHLVHRLPYGTRVANAALTQIHRELEESAYMSGAGSITTMRRVVLPLVKPAMVYLTLWTALLSLQEVSMALFLSGPRNQVLSVNIWGLWEGGNLGTAAAGTVVVAIVQFVLVFVALRIAEGVQPTGTAEPR